MIMPDEFDLPVENADHGKEHQDAGFLLRRPRQHHPGHPEPWTRPVAEHPGWQIVFVAEMFPGNALLCARQ
ncbi:MAG TPA: hypothetical protein DC061_08650 [Gemmobacter sp.]|nr:MAG: hypothetical protein A2X69_00430 [Rhodobacteraceae bacterium GWF1_65_7]HBD90645.1 hypothetical protein [Gemmobacter sp.]